ncbi:MAG: hypothetical protein KDI71_19000 [Xanthomonadales bacterium]|nr:hypothetical protein [Xanthomonadales bacterium]
MTPARHFKMLWQAVLVWFGFWLAGLPHYYQQYSMLVLAIGCSILSVLISLGAVYILARAKPSTMRSRAFWISLYYTAPFALLDTLYCGIYLGHGESYLWKYWYLTLFYFTPWITFPLTAWVLARRSVAACTRPLA